MTPNPSLSMCKSTFCLFWKNMLISSFRNRKSSLFQETVKFVTFFEKFLLKFPLWETVSQISSSLIRKLVSCWYSVPDWWKQSNEYKKTSRWFALVNIHVFAIYLFYFSKIWNTWDDLHEVIYHDFVGQLSGGS